MRAHVRTAGLAALVGLAAAAAATGDRAAVAGPDRKARGEDAIDISAYRSELIVLTDDDGNFYVVRPRAVGRDPGPVFVGDGKTFYAQRVVGSGADDSAGTWSYSLWAPRVAGYDDGGLWLAADKRYFLSCGSDKRVELRKLAAKDADKMLADAELLPALFDRVPHFLARDEDGVYYYVDIDRDPKMFEATTSDMHRYQHGHRVFVGKKGAMKAMPMTNVVSDREGEIYETKRGELRIVTSQDRTATWVRGRKKVPLKVLDITDNRYLVYRELGIYGFIGTVCEEL